MPLVVRQQVGLVENQNDGYAIGFGRGQKTVDECRGRLGLADGDDEQCLVDIGCQDMALLGQVDRLADNVVPAILYFINPVAFTQCHTVADGHGVGAAYALQAEVALYLAIKQLAIVCQDGVPAARILND